jgi:hypothetical protein
MARIRTIKPDLWQDETLAQVSVGARLLFIGLISMADDEGRLRGNPKLIRAEVFPYDVSKEVNVESWLDELVGSRKVVRYVVDEETFLWLPKFTEHQFIRKPSASKCPTPPERTSDALVTHQCVTSDARKGREGKGREEEGRGQSPDGDALVALWNSTADPKMPRCEGLRTKKRREQADALLVVVPFPEWPKLIGQANASAFCKGENDRGWRLSLSAMLKQPELALKVLEGNYSKGFKPGGFHRAEEFAGQHDPPGVVDLTDEFRFGPMPLDFSNPAAVKADRERKLAAERERLETAKVRKVPTP